MGKRPYDMYVQRAAAATATLADERAKTIALRRDMGERLRSVANEALRVREGGEVLVDVSGMIEEDGDGVVTTAEIRMAQVVLRLWVDETALLHATTQRVGGGAAQLAGLNVPLARLLRIIEVGTQQGAETSFVFAREVANATRTVSLVEIVAPQLEAAATEAQRLRREGQVRTFGHAMD